ncbi:hypothetical protein BBK36DRAFT_68208 [Trichoderma citrinoviride]|uniref:DUF7053 domain-containing protein n=1 Tax=Trichoderma citrinoviride TaxID=58853 RepID=A0A2T4B0U3_9HYPO|nr:hypothetical protein BBK36DRAFT_68208 [Trichoderma citrinoviride]PTB62920.1 hypothetical protein BBK36DRAFT_68208 [Trichoderma citrinoviride]
MSKRTVFTSITPLPPGISRQTAIDFLHNHRDMIDLNPLVTDRHVISPPPHALPEEHVCTWYSITDKISYLPGNLATGAISYTAAFHDLPMGLQTHCHAPMGVDLREKWTVGGSEPGEAPEPMELGLGAPRTGLYIREDVVITCNVMMASFIKKTIKKAHGTLIEALTAKAARSKDAQLAASHSDRAQATTTHYRQHSQPPQPTEAFQYRDQAPDTTELHYGYPPEVMAPRAMRTPPHAYVPELQ